MASGRDVMGVHSLCSCLAPGLPRQTSKSFDSVHSAPVDIEAPPARALHATPTEFHTKQPPLNLTPVADMKASKAPSATQSSGQARQEKVRTSFRLNDAASLVQHHDDINLDDVKEHAEDSDAVSGEYIKAFVLGGLDGIVSTFALVASLGGAQVPIPTLLAVGFAKVLADAFSMGFGEYTSATSEVEHNMTLKKREEWETDNFKEGEVKEMCEIYIQKGVAKEDALTLMTVLSNYRDLFVEHMMVMEHGVLFSEEDAADVWAPAKQGLVCFTAFAVFGLVPLLGFMVVYAIKGEDSGFSVELILGIAYVLTAVTLFIMGVTKSKLTGQENHSKSGLMMVMNGTVAGGCAYLVGEVLTAAFSA